MTPAAVVDVVIVNWNAGPQLRDCVGSLERFGDGLIATTVVVDNGSSDGSLDLVAGAPVVIDRAAENLGFGRACNRGAARGDADYILFLNPDAALHAGTLAETVRLMDGPRGQGVGICGVRLIDEHGHVARHCAAFPTWRSMVGQSLGLAGKVALFPPPFLVDFDHLTDRDVDQVIGAFYFVRRAVFTALGGFDERFFVYYEELDFALRARRRNWRTRYVGSLTSYHKGGGTSDRVKARRLFYLLRSRALYAMKHFTPLRAALVVAALALVEPLARLVRAAVHRSGAEVKDVARGTWLLWTDLPATVALARRAGSGPDQSGGDDGKDRTP